MYNWYAPGVARLAAQYFRHDNAEPLKLVRRHDRYAVLAQWTLARM
jgi:hypothetical protein